ncbi:MAG: hypothetical protein IIT46_08230 [Lachnospiraceae bacterium]|nr:hypothetical protein [Lachnospiraceae bacterium]
MEKSKLMAKSFKQLTDKSFHAQSNITAYQKPTSLQRLEEERKKRIYDKVMMMIEIPNIQESTND